MRNYGAIILTTVVLSIAITVAVTSWKLIPLQSWVPLFSGLLTALSLLAGAVLVRLARNVPITAISTFDDDDFKRFFNTLEELSSRLFWIFVQTLLGMTIVLFSMLITGNTHLNFPFYDQVAKGMSALLSGSVVWILWRIILVAKGDIGFLRLQRRILENALKRERKREASKAVAGPVIKSSPGRFGGVSSP